MVLKLQLDPFHLFKKTFQSRAVRPKEREEPLMSIQLIEEKKNLHLLPFDIGLRSDKKPFQPF